MRSIARLAPLVLLPSLLLLAPADSGRAAAPPKVPDVSLGRAAGGAATVHDTTRDAFGHALGNMQRGRLQQFRAGKTLFVTTRDASPHAKRGGLGPLYNADACNACHRKDGRDGVAATAADGPRLLRLGIPSATGGATPDPRYGSQLQDRATPGVVPEGRISVGWRNEHGRYPDGVSYTLRRPEVVIEALGHGALDSRTRWSLRIPPPLLGLGLLEAVAAETIEAWADPDDRDRDGISGRAQRVPMAGGTRIGRFGWKAGQVSLADQVATALVQDLGVRTAHRATSVCTDRQTSCRARDAVAPELAGHRFEQLVRYTQLLAVPAQRGTGRSEVRRGERLFTQVGCVSCHRSRLVTSEVTAALPELGGQTIRPYTDLLLHDLGEGLADALPEHGASGREWRTPPLWGLGLTAVVDGRVRLLHDGRARSVEEAILWHGGEGARARAAFMALAAEDRRTLLTFLSSL